MVEEIDIGNLKRWSSFQEQHFLQVGYKGSDISIFRHLLPKEGGLVLDVGCGFGDWTNEIHQLGYHVVIGVDLPGIIDQARIKYPDLQNHFYARDLEYEGLPIAIDRDTFVPGYDLVLGLGVIEHVIRYRRLFFMMAGVLAPNGYLFLTTCNNEARILEEWHFHHFDEKEFTELAEAAHIKPVEYSRTSLTNLRATFRRTI